MFRAVIFSGNHPRHLYLVNNIIDLFDDALIIMMDREPMLPKIPNDLSIIDKVNLERHFKTRETVENQFFGHINQRNSMISKKNFNVIRVTNVNDEKLIDIVAKFDGNMAFVFGTDVLKNSLLEILPKYKINLHLGLAPWYRGSATLFWPFYHLSPQFCGYTFHLLSNNVDSGDIIHQSCPILFETDGIHDVSARCVIDATEDSKKIIKKIKKGENLLVSKQRIQGRLWLSSDFKPYHLRVLYNLFNDNIVSEYLKKRLDSNLPNLISNI